MGATTLFLDVKTSHGMRRAMTSSAMSLHSLRYVVFRAHGLRHGCGGTPPRRDDLSRLSARHGLAAMSLPYYHTPPPVRVCAWV